MERTLADFLTLAPVFLRLPEGQIVYWSTGCEELYGYSAEEAVGEISHDLLKTVFPAPLDTIQAVLETSGEWRGRLRHTRKNGETLWTESLWRLRHAARPTARLVVEQNTDVSDRIEVERHRELLTRELNHRVKNTLAIVQGVARLTFARAEKDLLDTFDQRLAALSEAHNVLTRERWSHANLREIIGDVVRGLHLDGRLFLHGADVRLTPNAAVAYALAFHELATNAMKHGALAGVGGRVDIEWTVRGSRGESIHLTWRERDGPSVSPPAREGFGTRLIRRVIEAELNTPVELRYEPEGFVCEFDGAVQNAPPGLLSSSGVFDPER